MLVSDIIKTSLEYLGMHSAAQALEDGTYTDNAEYARTIDVLLHCYNAVEDELARGFLPIEHSQSFAAWTGKVYFYVFEKTPVKILSISADGIDFDFKIEPEYVQIINKSNYMISNVVIKYSVCPEKKALGDESDYSGYPAGERLFAYGMAAEYCLISGAFEESQMWESRYRQEIERMRPYKKASGDLPGRNWV